MMQRAVIRVGAGSARLRNRWFGARLREKREAAGLKVKEAAALVQRSHATLSQWENGATVPRLPDVLFLLECYGVSGKERDAIVRLQEQARERRDTSEVVSAAAAEYAWSEGRAWKFETFRDSVVPGLLQTPQYAREVLTAWDPTVGAERIERALAARMARQQRLLGDDPLRLSAILDENVLRRPVGGPEVMRAQLRHLVDASALANVELRVVPYAVGTHAGLPGPFVVLRLRDDRDLAYIETRGGEIYLDDAEPFAQTLRRLSTVALPAKKSVAMIAAMRREIT